MDLLLLAMLPMILFLGANTTYTDLRYGKIRNVHIRAALLYGIAAYALLSAFFILSGPGIRHEYLMDVALNSGLALAFAFIGWNYGLWSAADGKLFFAYSLLVPLSSYSALYLAHFPSFLILVNTFIPALIFIVFSALRRGRIEVPGLPSRLYEIPFLIITILGVSWFTRLVSSAGINLGIIGSLFLVWSIVYSLYRIRFHYRISIALALIALRQFLDPYFFLNTLFIYEAGFLISITVIMYLAMTLLRGFTENPAVPVSSLKPGMILDELIHEKEGKFNKSPLSVKSSVPGNSLLIMHTDSGLNRETVRKIKKLSNQGKLGFSEIRIRGTIPFAPFLFLGTILTLISGGVFFLAGLV